VSWAPIGFRGRSARLAQTHRWQVWLVEPNGERLNASFGGLDRAFKEKDWYVARGYTVDIRYVEVQP
jgi:hypothetical protein